MFTALDRRIQKLSTSVVNKIAAGEVIERPASVVKELLENCVDALATRIDVEIDQGGADLIRIVDNGEGIHPDDVLLAVTSHATSKLTVAEDLFQVATMGFRGEALASIAEVSHFRLRSKQRDQPGGVDLIVEGGQVRSQKLCGCPDGTQIEVRQLFFNTPVRRRFLKTASTEFAHIAEQFTRIAIANPRLQMTLRHGERLIHDLPPTDNLLERLELFFGSELARDLMPVAAEHQGVRVWGYAAHPRHSKTSRKHQYLFLNGRWIQDRSLQHALGEAYRGLVMVGRYPVAFLFLELAPELVDVNVHPTKAEVRFQDSQSLYRLLLSTLRSKFLSMELDSPLTLPTAPSNRAERGATLLQQELSAWVEQSISPQTDAPITGSPAVMGMLFPSANATPFASIPAASSAEASDSEADFVANVGSVLASSTAVTAEPAGAPLTPAQPLRQGDVRAMQVHDCYLVVETSEGLTVIDQHALHERIMYEQLRQRVLSGGVEVQRLLIPQVAELPPRQAALLLDHADSLRELGLLIEDFGGNSIALTGFPVMLSRMGPTALLQDVADLLDGLGRTPERRDLLDKLLHMMSCKAAIKAGQRLAPEEIDSLLAQRHLCDDAHHCPHGRPTALKLSRTELDRQFGRLGS